MRKTNKSKIGIIAFNSQTIIKIKRRKTHKDFWFMIITYNYIRYTNTEIKF